MVGDKINNCSFFACIRRPEYSVFYSWNKDLPIENWKMISVSQRTDATFDRLNRSWIYFVAVQARNVNGYGPRSDIVQLLPEQSQGKTLLFACLFRQANRK